eukprot:gene21599-8138_t
MTQEARPPAEGHHISPSAFLLPSLPVHLPRSPAFLPPFPTPAVAPVVPHVPHVPYVPSVVPAGVSDDPQWHARAAHYHLPPHTRVWGACGSTSLPIPFFYHPLPAGHTAANAHAAGAAAARGDV